MLQDLGRSQEAENDKGVVAGFILGVLVLAVGVYYCFASGMAPVATADPMMHFERKLTNKALDAHIEKQHLGESPVPADEPNLLAGADVYKKDCARCHGLPDRHAGYVNTMFPRPTQLFSGKGVTDDLASESYWKAAHGIRLSGMRAFKDTLTSMASDPVDRARKRNPRIGEESPRPE